ncbi:MAG: TolC family protein, partial [Candidatus Methylomirabilaceae bacterium]
THVPQAEQALQASQIGYQTGTLDFLSLIDSVRAVEQVHLEHLTAAANLEKARAELERAVGQELPRTGLSGPFRQEQKGTCEERPKGECQEGHSSTKPASHARREAAEGRRGLRPEARYAKP